MSLVFITGAAGFIGHHLHKQLKTKNQVEAIDLLAPGNIAAAKRAAVQPVKQQNIHGAFLNDLANKPDVLIHLAAETGIAGSLKDPLKYFQTNVSATFNVLEQCRKNNVRFLIYASSSSVYTPGQSITAETGDTHTQLSFYGTTKKMGEQMIESYCAQFGITAIGLRFFTVYGSWTRPDMAAYKFMKAIENDMPVTLYNEGEVFRDFTHVSDVVNAIELLIDQIRTEKEGTHQLFNIGYGAPVSVKRYAELIAARLNKELAYTFAGLPANELPATHSNTSKLEQYINYKPKCSIEEGVKEMVDWFKKERYE
ncbi:MAG: NAD-dependent epimerase/dehydratase family protein [Bacteroidota bacterium]